MPATQARTPLSATKVRGGPWWQGGAFAQCWKAQIGQTAVMSPSRAPGYMKTLTAAPALASTRCRSAARHFVLSPSLLTDCVYIELADAPICRQCGRDGSKSSFNVASAELPSRCGTAGIDGPAAAYWNPYSSRCRDSSK
jgi:hypothetical protein